MAEGRGQSRAGGLPGWAASHGGLILANTDVGKQLFTPDMIDTKSDALCVNPTAASLHQSGQAVDDSSLKASAFF